MRWAPRATPGEFMGTLTVQQYVASKEKRAAVSHMVEIVGEAIRAGITNPSGIIGTRHRLAHGYDSIDDAAIWKIVQNDLPVLEREVEALLDDTISG